MNILHKKIDSTHHHLGKVLAVVIASMLLAEIENSRAEAVELIGEWFLDMIAFVELKCWVVSSCIK